MIQIKFSLLLYGNLPNKTSTPKISLPSWFQIQILRQYLMHSRMRINQKAMWTKFALILVDFHVLEHLIIGADIVSFAERGLL